MLSSGDFFKPGTVQNIAFTATAGQLTNAVGDSTRVVRIVSDQDCYYKFGANPTATTSDTFLPAGVVEYLAIARGEKISVVQASAGGTLNVTEMTK